MIYTIMRMVEGKLVSRGVPYPIVYGPERFHGGPASHPRIVIERDRLQGDTVDPPMSQFRNPRHGYLRQIGCIVRVFGASTLPGAMSQDHERVTDAVVDQLLIVLREVTDGIPTTLAWSSGRYLDDAALEDQGLEAWPGVVYELRCKVGRGVADVNWQGESAAEATIGGTGGVAIATRMTVGRQGSSDLPEPVSGG